MEIQIKHRYNKVVLFEGDFDSLASALVEAVRKGADLSNANLRSADLSNANLRYANLSNADLRNADLRNANLCNADLRNANLCNANLHNANLCDANLRDAKNIERNNLQTSEYTKGGGPWLGAARSWVQWNCKNGSDVTWGSNEELVPPLTIRQVEELAARVTDAAIPEMDKLKKELETLRKKYLSVQIELEQLRARNNIKGQSDE